MYLSLPGLAPLLTHALTLTAAGFERGTRGDFDRGGVTVEADPTVKAPLRPLREAFEGAAVVMS